MYSLKILRSVFGWCLGLMIGLCGFVLSEIFILGSAYAGEGLSDNPPEVTDHIFSFLTGPNLLQIAQTSRLMNSVAKDRFRFERSEALKRISKRFVRVPEAQLPNGKIIPSFEALSVITREDWENFMLLPPKRYQSGAGNWDWNRCRSCPVTHVSIREIQENGDEELGEIPNFVRYVNREADKQGQRCVYSVGTAEQWQVAFVGRSENLPEQPYLNAKTKDGAGVEVVVRINTEQEASAYVWHARNADLDGNGPMIQPIGTKLQNVLGLERPSVSILTESQYSPDHPEFGYAVMGASFSDDISEARPEFQAGMKRSNESVGFSLVRVCS